MRKTIVMVAACATLLLLRPGLAGATKCLDDAGDPAQIAAVRAAVDSTCKCFAPGITPGAYVSCAVGIINARAGTSLRTECAGTVKRIYAHSVCGRLAGGNGPATPCVSMKSSTVSCTIKPWWMCYSKPPKRSKPCGGPTTCLDAADSNSDLKIDASDSEDCQFSPGSFVDNGDGTVTDSRTGLVWEKLSDDGSIHDWNSRYTWADAAAVKVAALNSMPCFATHCDWRLPTVAELQALVVDNGTSPAVAPALDNGCAPGCTVTSCSCTQPFGYWSSTTYHYNPGAAWFVGFSDGYVDNFIKSSSFWVRAVRGG